ncbi:MAG: bifunctional DNA primase/polymerase [Phycisphaerales bacterium]|nr:bifunctional DNA primase/polymerase [Phycisphaerales bacterium]
MTILDHARQLTEGGLRVLPIPPRAKAPAIAGWQTLRLTGDQLAGAFIDESANIGTLLGEPSGWVIDIDLDSDDARRLADDFLPPTPATFGRAGAPRSHRLYRLTSPAPTRKFLAPDGSMILELRSTGCQTVAPGSVHPTGERIVWMAPDGSTVNEWPGDPAPIDPEHLRVNLEALATACGWQAKPAKGSGAPSAPLAAPMAPAGSTTVYGARVLEAECSDVASTAEGGRNHRLNTAAFKIGQLIPHEIERSDAERALMAAARQCGLGDAEAFATIRSGLDGGAKYPREKAERIVDTYGVDLSYLDAKTSTPTDARCFDDEDPGHMPAELFNVPGFIGDVMAYTLASAPYPNRPLAFAGALALLATLAGRKVRDALDNRPNFYTLALANSGTGKDAPRKTNSMILDAVNMSRSLADGIASGEGLEDALYSTPNLLIQLDEIDTLLTSVAKSKDGRYESLSKALLQLYSNADRRFNLRLKAGRQDRLSIDQPCLNLLGTATPANFYSALTVKQLTGGLVARFTIVEAGRRGAGQKPTIREIPERVLEVARFWAELKPGAGNMAETHPSPRMIEITPEGDSLSEEIKKDAEAEYERAEIAGDQIALAVWARVYQQARKLALVYAISENHKDPSIGAEAIRWAGAFAKHQARRTLFMAASHAAESPFDELVRRVIRRLREAPGRSMGHSDLLRATKLDAKAFGSVIDTLAQRGDVIPEKVPTGGREGIVYRLARVKEGGAA